MNPQNETISPDGQFLDREEELTEPISLSPRDFLSAYQSDPSACLLDVRRPVEYAEVHLQGAQLLDWLDVERFAEGMQQLDRDKTYYIYCRSGRRSYDAALLLQQFGYQVRDLSGGILAWLDEELPLQLK